ncbi:hypothetical protein SLS59_009156 [Nothophoma quercina]|uniref:Uncharacterized protein n=1 Tax=Nothophoma quercina TaxID=749835 RepID=A0ABR3QNC2_9PLEO
MPSTINFKVSKSNKVGKVNKRAAESAELPGSTAKKTRRSTRADSDDEFGELQFNEPKTKANGKGKEPAMSDDDSDHMDGLDHDDFDDIQLSTGKGKGKAIQAVRLDAEQDYKYMSDTSSDEDEDEDAGDINDGCVFETSYHEFEDEETVNNEQVGDNELDQSEKYINQSISVPKRLLPAKRDRRLGSATSMPSVNAYNKIDRTEKFDNGVRRIIRGLKETARRHPQYAGEDGVQISTASFASLLSRADEDFLVDSVLAGVPESTKLILGMEQYTLDDLKLLPRLPDSQLSESGIYIDVVEIGDNTLEWKLYVGSASGQYGVLLRWYTYTGPSGDKSAHSQEIRKPGRRINLRCVANFGYSPEFWLIPLAESIFILYLGTLRDPRISWDKPSYESYFIYDELYKEVENILSKCALVTLEGRGLNRTLPLLQGWKGPGFTTGTKCGNCSRVVLDPKDPAFSRRHWTYTDPERPSGTKLTCRNCKKYYQKRGTARPEKNEERRKVLVTTRAYRDNPGHCEYDGCSRQSVPQWCGPAEKFYCGVHMSRAIRGQDMSGPYSVIKPTRIGSTGEKPDKCQHKGCDATNSIKWVGIEGHKKWYCGSHWNKVHRGEDLDRANAHSTAKGERSDTCQFSECSIGGKTIWFEDHQKYYCRNHWDRAYNGTNMSKPMRNNDKPPSQCQYNGCSITNRIKWCNKTGHEEWYCNGHYRRAMRGQNMAPPIRPQAARPKKSRPDDKPPSQCQYNGCSITNDIKWCNKTGHEEWYCNGHYKRAMKDQDMAPPIRRQGARSKSKST